MDEPDGGGTESHDGTSRRWFLIGGVGTAVVLLGAGAGVAAEFLTHSKPPRPRPPTPPRPLVDAVAAERALLADLDATTGGAPAVRAVIAQVRADHAAHLSALTELVASYGVVSGATPPSASKSSAAPRGTPRTRAQLRAAEARAGDAAATHAAALTGARAALLASIAAAEASHAELLG